MAPLIIAFQAALVGLIILLLVLLATTAYAGGDLPPGWATITAGLITAAAVALMGWLGFLYQDRQRKRDRIDGACAVAAPIRTGGMGEPSASTEPAPHRHPFRAVAARAKLAPAMDGRRRHGVAPANRGRSQRSTASPSAATRRSAARSRARAISA